jgi:hypothetical protein
MLFWFPFEIEALIGIGKLEEAEALLDWVEERALRLDRAWALPTGHRGRGRLKESRDCWRGRPAASDELTVPAQQCVRLHPKARPGWPWQRPTQGRQKRPISLGQLRPRSLPTQDRQLVAQNKDLQLLRATRPPEQP